MAEIGSAFLSILPSAKGFGSKLEAETGGEVKKSGGKMGALVGAGLKTGALAVAGGAGALIGASLVKGFQRLNAIDQAKAKLTGLGNSAKTVDVIMSNALASVKGTAFGLDEAATVAASAVAAGIKPGQQLTGVLKTVADTATIAGASMSDTGAIFGSVAARGRLQGDDLMQLQSRGVPVLAFLAKHYKITAAAASKMVSDGQVDFRNFAAAMKEGLGGAALASGKTFSGAFANLKASLGRIGANLLSGLFPLLKSGINGLTGILSGLEPVATKIGTAIGNGLGKVGPIISRVVAGIGGLFSSLRGNSDVTSAAGSIVGFAKSIGAQVVPVLAQVGRVITTQVLPFVKALAQGFITNVLPVFAKVYASVAGSLMPVFKSLANAFTTQILPALSNLLTTIKPYIPTFLKVAGIIVSVLGFFLRMGAAILGFVLPPLIKLAAILIGGLIRSFGIVIAAIGGVLRFFGALGSAFGRAVGFAVRFGLGVVRAIQGGFQRMVTIARALLAALVAVVGNRIAAAIGAVRRVVEIAKIFSSAFGRARDAVAAGIGKVVGLAKSLPGRIRGAIGALGSALYHSGQELIDGLIRGITSKLAAVASKMKEVAAKVKGFLPGSPVKEGPLTSWNNGGAGKRLMGMLADGIDAGSPGAVASMRAASRSLAGGLSSPSFGAAGSAGAGGMGGGVDGARFRLVLDDGTPLTGHIERVADNVFFSNAALATQGR